MRVLNPQYARALSELLISSATFLKKEIELANSCDDDHATIEITELLTTVANLEGVAAFLKQISDPAQARAEVEGRK